MSHRLGDSNLISNSHVISSNGGLGVVSENIPSAGNNGAGYAFPSLDLPTDNGKEVRGEVTIQPYVILGSGAIVSFFAYEDTSYDLEVTGDCAVQWVFNLYVDGVLIKAGLVSTIFIGYYDKPEKRKRKITMNYNAIRQELDNNAGLYGSLTDAQVAAELNAADKVQNKTSMSRQEVLAQIDPAALSTLTGDNATKVFGILSDSVDPFGNASQVLIDAFGGGSTTITNLAAARTETVTRASQIGVGNVQVNDVTIARNL